MIPVAEIPAVGDAVAPLTVTPTEAQLFAFSAITWNPHRIHYDQAYTRSEGYDDVLVQAHLHAAFLGRAVRAAYGPGTRVRRIGWQNRGPAGPGDTLTVTGTVVGVTTEDGAAIVECKLEERNERGELCVRGWATVALQGPSA
jgi:hydroxyacyl-ACP dehydratase HTD2-like protein with hotdog domain